MSAGGHELRIAILVMVALIAVACVKAQPPPAALPDVAAADYITAAFKTHPLVAFSEPGHGAIGTKEFLAALIRRPGTLFRRTARRSPRHPSRHGRPSPPSSNEIQD